MRDFDMGDAWRQIVAMFQGNRDVLLTLAGLFFFVPNLLLNFMSKEPPQPAEGATLNDMMQQISAYYTDNLPWFAVVFVATGLGALVIWRHLLAPGGTSLGSALSVATALLLSYLGGAILAGFGVAVGLLAFLIPGLYLQARLSLMGPTMAAEHRLNPIDALMKSWSYTRNNGFLILLFSLAVLVIGMIAMMIAQAIFGTLFALILPEPTANIGDQIIRAVLSAAISLVSTLLLAAIYRQLGQTNDGAAFR